jgi:hypothetical protein
VLAHHHHLALREPAVADVDVDRLADDAIELDDRADAELQHLLHRQAGAPDLDHDRHRDVHQRVERGGGGDRGVVERRRHRRRRIEGAHETLPSRVRPGREATGTEIMV